MIEIDDEQGVNNAPSIVRTDYKEYTKLFSDRFEKGDMRRRKPVEHLADVLRLARLRGVLLEAVYAAQADETPEAAGE